MNKNGERYNLAFIFAVLIHIVLFSFLFFKSRDPQPRLANPNQNIIHAVAINTNALSKPLAKPFEARMSKQAEKKSSILQQEREHIKRITKQQALAQQQLKQQQIKQAKEQLAEKKHKAEITKQLEKSKKEQQTKLAEQLKQQQTKAEKIKQDRLAKEKAEQEANRQKELTDKLARQKAADDFNKQLAAEDQQLAAEAAQNARVEQEVDKYKAVIIQAISQRWIVPDNTKEGLSCKVRIRLAPGGMVLNVKLLTSSGDPALDRSAIAAVNKSSPLPVPADAVAFEQFREIDLIVQPHS